MLQINKNNSILLDTIQQAENTIQLVSFQFSNLDIIDLLKEKAKKGLEVEVITLPVDTINNRKKQETIKEIYSEARALGVSINENQWEVGDPTLTDTSESGDISEGGGDKWYSMHGKFLVTDNHALILSANITDREEFNTFLRYSDHKTILLFKEKFNWLLNNFISQYEFSSIPGEILQKFSTDKQEEFEDIYESTNRICPKGYPSTLAPEDVTLKRDFYVAPFDARARAVLESMVKKSQKYIYLLSERLYDETLVHTLKQKALNTDVKITIVTGPPESVRQNIPKAREYFKELASAGVRLVAVDDFHAKTWLTESWLAVGSANLTKMNLGFRRSGVWRANTETVLLEKDKSLIEEGKAKIEDLTRTAETKTAADVLGTSGSARRTAKDFFDLFNHYSRKQAKITFGKLKFKYEQESLKHVQNIARFAAKIAKYYEETYIKREHVVMSAILVKLKERASTKREIEDELEDVIDFEIIEKCIDNLVEGGFILPQKDKFEINLEHLLT